MQSRDRIASPRRRAALPRHILPLLALLLAAASAPAAIAVAGGQMIPVPTPGAGYANDNNHPWPFMMFLPNGYSPSGPPCPLVFCLHGNGEVGNGSSDGTLVASTSNQLAYLFGSGPLPLIRNGSTYFGDHNCIVVQPQSNVGNGAAFNANRVDLTMQYVLANYNVDHSRIYTMGLSAGGGGLVRYAYAFANNPNYQFAAIIPIANIQGLGTSYTDFTKFTGSITWLIGDCDDTTAYIRLDTGRINQGATGNVSGYGWAGGISTCIDQAVNGGALPPDSLKTRCLNTHPDYAAILASGFNANNGDIAASLITSTATGYYQTANPLGWTWVAGQTFTAGSQLQVTIRKGGGHSGWNETFGAGSSPNLPFWNWLLAQRLGQAPTGYSTGTPSVAVNPGTAILVASQTQQFTATALDADGATISPQPTITWSCGSGGSITSGGLFTATGSSGTVTVTAQATIAGVVRAGTATVTLAAPTIVVSPATATVYASQTIIFTAKAKGHEGTDLAMQPTFSWSCGSGGSINASTGAFTALDGSGTVTVTASATLGSSGYSGTSTVSLAAPTIVVLPGTPTLVASQTQTFTAKAKGAGGVDFPVQPAFSWSCSAGGSINASSGLFIATAAAGNVTVTARATCGSGSYSGVAAITLAAPTITVTPDSASVVATQTQSFAVVATGVGGTILAPQPVFTWTCGSGGSINPATGLFTAIAGSGSAVITASTTIAGTGYSGTASVSLLPPTIEVTPTSNTVAALQTQTFSAIATGAGHAALAVKPAFSWSCGSGGSIDTTSGLFTATSSSGTVTVTATGNISGSNYSGSALVKLTAPTVVVSPFAASLNASDARQFSARAKGVGGVDLPTQPVFTWASGTGGTVDAATGWFRALDGSGSVTVIAAATIGDAPCSGSATVTLTAPTIVVSPEAPTLVASETQSFSAVARGADGRILATQPAFIWSCNASGVVDPITGDFTAMAGSGIATVTATATIGSSAYTGAASVSLMAPVIAITPTTANVTTGQSQLFHAVAREPAGADLPVQPAFSWSVGGSGGSIDAGGLFSASSGSGGIDVIASATVGGVVYSQAVRVDLRPASPRSGGGSGSGGGGGGCGLGAGLGGILAALLLFGLRRQR